MLVFPRFIVLNHWLEEKPIIIPRISRNHPKTPQRLVPLRGRINRDRCCSAAGWVPSMEFLPYRISGTSY